MAQNKQLNFIAKTKMLNVGFINKYAANSHMGVRGGGGGVGAINISLLPITSLKSLSISLPPITFSE